MFANTYIQVSQTTAIPLRIFHCQYQSGGSLHGYEFTKLTGLQQEPLPTESVSTIHFKHPTAAQWTCTHSTTCTTRHGTFWGHLRSLSVLNSANKSTSSLYASIAWYPITLFLYRVASPCTVVIVLFIYLCHFLVPDRTNIISQWCSKICGRLY